MTDLEQFAEDFRQEVLARAAEEESEAFTGEAFVELFTEYLATNGEVEDATPCFYRGRRSGADAYSSDDDEGRLDLFIAIRTQGVPPGRIGRADIERAFRRLDMFLQEASDGLRSRIEISSPAYDMAAEVERVSSDLSRIRFFLITDGLVATEQLPEIEFRGLPVSLHIWDMQRLFRLLTSGQGRDTIHIDFEAQFGAALPCLVGPNLGEHRVYLTLIPGDVLNQIYDHYGPRLLERNVRSFLQARGGVNKGIRDTIRTEPERFLAYNNGLSATAGAIELTETSPPAIRSLTGLQIVNGAQTTASIHSAVRRDRADISHIAVQAKIVIVDADQADAVIPKISLYANSQNRITQADFSANDPFHVQIEALSRTVWAPSPTGTQQQTKWFYERARGQYADEKARLGTPARQRTFMREYPLAQKFTKTDLAKFAHAYEGLPHLVSRGAQKNFVEFTLRLGDRGEVQPGVEEFQALIAQGILFRTTEKLVSQQRFGGYRANIVAYTISLLATHFGEHLDLRAIWRTQSLDATLKELIAEVSHAVHRLITDPPNGRNITEWCKSQSCWESIRDAVRPHEFTLAARASRATDNVEVPAPVEASAVAPATAPQRPAITDAAAITMVEPISAESWFTLAKWAREGSHLYPWQRSLAYSLGQRRARGIPPTAKQARQALVLIEASERFGFQPFRGMTESIWA